MAKGCTASQVFLIFTTRLYQFLSVFSLFALFSDESKVFLPQYSQMAILQAAHFRRVVKTDYLSRHMSKYKFIKAGNSIGPVTRCDEMYHFAVILRLLEASQTTADHRRCLLENRSSVASQLPTMNCFYFLLRFSSQQWHIELFNWECLVSYDTTANGIPITMLKTVWESSCE